MVSSSSSKCHLLLHIDADTAHYIFGTEPCWHSKWGLLLFYRMYWILVVVALTLGISGHHQKGHQPKKRKKRELSYKTAIASPFYRQYLTIATSSSSIYNDSSGVGLKFRHRFRISYLMFNHFMTP
jgi:hypothetical protein